MLGSQKLAIAAHLHVLLRRKTGRVTDTEWMAQNLDYATEIIRFARLKAAEDGHPDLAEWAGKLEQAVAQSSPAHKPLAQTAMELLRERQAAAGGPAPAAPAPPEPEATRDSGFFDSVLDAAKRKTAEPPSPRYVGGIR